MFDWLRMFQEQHHALSDLSVGSHQDLHLGVSVALHGEWQRELQTEHPHLQNRILVAIAATAAAAAALLLPLEQLWQRAQKP